MALPFGDNVFSKFFTPKEYQVDLLEAAKAENIIACIGNVSTRTFISLKLLQELSSLFTGQYHGLEDQKYALFVVESSQKAVHYASAIKYLTDLGLNDLTVHNVLSNGNFISMTNRTQIILATSLQAWELISNGFVTWKMIYLLIVDDCHCATTKNHPLNKLMTRLGSNKGIRIFGMMFPIYATSNTNPGKVEANLNELENVMGCRVETASDIVSILKYNCKPNEYLIECDESAEGDLERLLMSEISITVRFLEEHRYDPSEIYEGELLEELRSNGDPVEEPLNIIREFVYVLNTMGAWCANKAALASLFIIEKLKLKTPYERHFLLLCVVSSLMLRIRNLLDDYFSHLSEYEQLLKFTSPKVRRLIEIFRCHKPSQRTGPEIADNSFKDGAEDVVESDIHAEVKSSPFTICDSYIRYKNDKANRHKNKKKYQPKSVHSKLRSHFDDSEVVSCVIFVKSRLVATVVHYLLAVSKPWSRIVHSERPPHIPSVHDYIKCVHLFTCGGEILFTYPWEPEYLDFGGGKYCSFWSLASAADIHADLKKLDDNDFWWLMPQFTIEKTADFEKEPRDAEIQHRNLEDVLRKFRTKDCNILIGTSMLEEGIDLPKCNLVIRFDIPPTFCSYIYSKSKACANNANFFIMFELPHKNIFINDLSRYYEIEQLLLKRCASKMDDLEDILDADKFTQSVIPYVPVTGDDVGVHVNLETAIACVNRYCAKLPSDSFTRLTPSWTTRQVTYNGKPCYITSIRLPINSPYKAEIQGHPMPTPVLSRRVAALETCRVLHMTGELDDNLLPIGKESFHLLLSAEELVLDEADQLQASKDDEPRPGTNKRRQYYRKRVANCFTECRPLTQTPLYLYAIKMVLSCPLPEEQNTRGRKIHAPEDSPCGFGILLTKKMPKICPFPIFIRCGEVMVSIELVDDKLLLMPEQLERISAFLDYTFTKVLRLHKYFMTFDSTNAPSSYFIVPTITDSTGTVNVDWSFLDRVHKRRSQELSTITDSDRTNFTFSKQLYDDAVVMPWYRNQDFPQHFYVAEICWNLSPRSEFPGVEYKTFEEYYFRKYHLKIQNVGQPLLDVDHTSMRLNFLTPRYVNRKGVALPTCSEATKKAKRESLAQKQILVPELCQIHTFSASLWRKAVALPCVMYRLNSLLLAEEIRNQVSREIDLGLNIVPEAFEWEPLNFGWTLADVVRRTNELRDMKAQKENGRELLRTNDYDEQEGDDGCAKKEAVVATRVAAAATPAKERFHDDQQKRKDEDEDDDDAVNESSDGEQLMEIGTWSNDMAGHLQTLSSDSEDNGWPVFNDGTPAVRYGSPTNWSNDNENDFYMDDASESIADSTSSCSDSFQNPTGLRIEFRNEFLAEAIDRIEECCLVDNCINTKNEWLWENCCCIDSDIERETEQFEKAVQKNRQQILNSGRIIDSLDTLRRFKPFGRDALNRAVCPTPEQKLLSWNLPSSDAGYGAPVGHPFHSDESTNCRHRMRAGTPNKSELSASAGPTTLPECQYEDEMNAEEEEKLQFRFDHQPDLSNHAGPSPSVLLQALTMSNANDGINLERLETIGDSFLKYAITNYLYSTHENVHEGKLSHIRSKQVSNLHLYKLGNRKMLGECMVASKFEPHDNWLPPCFRIPCELEKALIENKVSSCFWKVENLPLLWNVTAQDLKFEKKTKIEEIGLVENSEEDVVYLPFHLIAYHAIPDKSIADCVEALIGAYLISCGIRGALLFMSWLGIKVLPAVNETNDESAEAESEVTEYGHLQPPSSPLIRNVADPEGELKQLIIGYDQFERTIRYRFNDQSYLLQAMTHASYSPNRVTDCYQRLEFLGDAVLDYLITRHLYEDRRQHSPGALTDLRSALVNNTIFAALAVRFGFHKYFRHLSPGLAEVINRFVRIQEENDHAIFEEYYLINEDECEEVEDVEVPKALGDIFESVAGAIFLDSGMSLDAVWKVYYRIMKNEIEQFSTNVPKSPIRELLEMEPETAKFGRPEKLADGKRVRVTVEVFGKGQFKGIGRNYRIAKCTAAKCALKQLKKRGLVSNRQTGSKNTDTN